LKTKFWNCSEFSISIPKMNKLKKWPVFFNSVVNYTVFHKRSTKTILDFYHFLPKMSFRLGKFPFSNTPTRSQNICVALNQGTPNRLIWPSRIFLSEKTKFREISKFSNPGIRPSYHFCSKMTIKNENFEVSQHSAYLSQTGIHGPLDWT